MLRDNDNIYSFDELRFFTNIETLSGLGYCTNLTKLTLPEGGMLRKLGGECLYGSALTPVFSVPEGVTTFANHAIGRGTCMVVNLYLPSTTATFEGFFMMFSTHIQNIIIKAAIPPAVASNTLPNIPTSVQFYVPDTALQAYLNDSSWGSYSTRIHPISEYVEA